MILSIRKIKSKATEKPLKSVKKSSSREKQSKQKKCIASGIEFIATGDETLPKGCLTERNVNKNRLKKKVKSDKSKSKISFPKESAGKIWRKDFLKNLKDNDHSEDDDFEPIEKEKDVEMKKSLKTEILGEINLLDDDNDDYKPASLEHLITKVEKELKNTKKRKKERVRLLKLPKQSEKELNTSDIQDHQIGFCSQVSMDTLYNRCQNKRKSQALEILMEEEDEIEKEVGTLETDNNIINGSAVVENDLMLKNTYIKNHVNRKDKQFLHFSQTENSDEVKDSQDLSPLLPMSTPKKQKMTKPPPKICIVTPIVRHSVPEAPQLDIDLSSFLFESSLLDSKSDNPSLKQGLAQEQVDLKMDFNDVNINENNKKTIDVSKEVQLNDLCFTNVKEKLTNFHEMDNDLALIDDSLINFVNESDGDDEMCSSPPMISQVPIKTVCSQNCTMLLQKNVLKNVHASVNEKLTIAALNNTAMESKNYRLKDKQLLNLENKMVDCNNSNNKVNFDDDSSPVVRKINNYKKKRVLEESVCLQNDIQLDSENLMQSDPESPLFVKSKSRALKRKKCIFESQTSPLSFDELKENESGDTVKGKM